MNHYRGLHPDLADHPNLMAMTNSINIALAMVGIEPDKVGGVLDEAELADHPVMIVLRNIISRASDKVRARLEETNPATDPDLFALYDKLLLEADQLDLEYKINLAKDGCTDFAKALQAEAASYFEKHEPLPKLLGDYYAEASRKIAGGGDETKAYHLNKSGPSGGRNKYAGGLHDLLICLEVRLAFLETDKMGEAYEIVADKYKYTDARSVSNVFGERCSFWNINQQSKEELQNAIANLREVSGK